MLTVDATYGTVDVAHGTALGCVSHDVINDAAMAQLAAAWCAAFWGAFSVRSANATQSPVRGTLSPVVILDIITSQLAAIWRALRGSASSIPRHLGAGTVEAACGTALGSISHSVTSNTLLPSTSSCALHIGPRMVVTVQVPVGVSRVVASGA